MFISFEGIEGAGKTSIIKAVRDYLKNRGIGFIITREPGSTKTGKKIRAILLDPENKNMDFRTELLLYMADRAQHIADIIKPALKSGKLVLCDRYFDATLAYQGYGRGIDKKIIKKLHGLIFDNFMPDITFLLDLFPETGLSRAWKDINSGGRDEKETRFEKEKMEFHKKVRQGYLDMAAKEPERFRIINAEKSFQDVRDEIIKILDRELL